MVQTSELPLDELFKVTMTAFDDMDSLVANDFGLVKELKIVHFYAFQPGTLVGATPGTL